MDLISMIGIGALVVANIGTTIVLFTWSVSHASQDSRETKRILEAIQTEMKDFHGRLCDIEARNSTRSK